MTKLRQTSSGRFASGPPPSPSDRRDLRNALLCAAAVTAAFLLVNPFVKMPFDDDWSYAFTTRQLLATGHLTYNGWSAPLLISHAAWGAVFAKLFGYSFVSLRLSTLPFAVVCAIFSYLLARAAELRPPGAVVVSLTLCLSPVFLPLADSFMTDVPALGYMLISLYALMRAAQSPRPIGWLILGTLAGIVGGMGRQTVWICPVCIIPYLVFIRRSHRKFVVAGVIAWLIVLLDIYFCLRWFGRQPNVFLDPPLTKSLYRGVTHPHVTVTNILMFAFTTILFSLPACLPFAVDSIVRLWRKRKTWRAAVSAAVILILSLAISAKPDFGMAPWLYDIVTARGVLGPLEISGSRPVVIPLVARGFISALVLMTVYLLAARLVEFVIDGRASVARLRNFFSAPGSRQILMIFAAAYCLLMIVRSCQDLVFDRYCLPLIPCLAVILLRRRSLAFAWPVLIVYTVYAIALTQDNFALAAARRAAIDRLESHGILRTQIAAGFEYNFYTQLEEMGYVNHYGVTNPAIPFNEFQGYTPALKPKYRLEFPRAADTVASPFGVVDYNSWLPPFHRRVYIDEFKNPWWLDTSQPGGRINPLNYEFDYEN